MGFPGGALGKEPACQCRRHKSRGSIPGSGDPLEEGMATHSSILAWRILWTEEPGGLPFIDGYLIEIVIILCVYGFKLFSFLKYFSLRL